MTSGLWIEIIISYDISENKKRKKIYDFLLDINLQPIQKSLFWGRILFPELKDLKNRLEKNYFKLEKEDKVIITKVNILGNHSSLHGHNTNDFVHKEFLIV